MPLYEGIDYRVCIMAFPNLASEALVLSNGDGGYTVLLNALYPEEVLRERLKHELEHMRADHLHQPERSVAEKEAEADGRAVPAWPSAERGGGPSSPVPEPGQWEPFRPGERGDYLSSWGRAMAWARRMMDREPPPEARK